MKKVIFVTACVFVLILGWQCFAELESFKSLTVGLQDGMYLIDRINYAPFPHFPSESQAKAWYENYKKNPSSLKPEHEFFQLYLNGNDFIIHQLIQTESGEYVPKGNFFVSVSDVSAWAFEENASRITIITNLNGLDSAGPVAGLLQTGDNFCKELKEMGFGKLDLSSIKQVGSNAIAGKDIKGNLFDGEMQRNDQGQITNIISKMASTSKNYELNMDISQNKTISQLLAVKISKRYEGSQAWQDIVGYTIITNSPITKLFRMDEYWRQFANTNTLLVYFDAKSKTTIIHETNGVTRPLGRSDMVADLPHSSHARWFALTLLAISTIFGLAILVRMSRRPNT